MPYFEIIDLNTIRDNVRESNLKYTGETLNIGDVSSLYCNKFKISAKIPVYIPRLTNLTSTPSNIPIPGYTDNTNTNSDYYKMKWSTEFKIVVADTQTKKTSTQYVKWSPQALGAYSPPYPPSISQVITNNYFHCYNSIHLLLIIENAFNQALTDIGKTAFVKFVKSEGTYQLLIPSALITSNKVNFYVNYEFERAFNFYYVADDIGNGMEMTSIVTNEENNIELSNITYIIVQVLSLTTRIFPFYSFVFESSDLPVEQIHDLTNIISNQKIKQPEFLGFYLTITDLDNIADSISYTATNYFRDNPITTSLLSRFSINCNFKTIDGYTMPLMLDFMDYITIQLQFR